VSVSEARAGGEGESLNPCSRFPVVKKDLKTNLNQGQAERLSAESFRG